jgi:hypothetical protein
MIQKAACLLLSPLFYALPGYLTNPNFSLGPLSLLCNLFLYDLALTFSILCSVSAVDAVEKTRVVASAGMIGWQQGGQLAAPPKGIDPRLQSEVIERLLSLQQEAAAAAGALHEVASFATLFKAHLAPCLLPPAFDIVATLSLSIYIYIYRCVLLYLLFVVFCAGGGGQGEGEGEGVCSARTQARTQHTNAHTHTHTHSHTHKHTHIYTYIHTHIYTQHDTHTHTHTHTHTTNHTYTHTQTHSLTLKHTHTHTHKHTRAHTHTYAPEYCSPLCPSIRSIWCPT